MKALIILLTLPLAGCITLTHTLSDGTRISVSPDRASVSNGKSVIDLTLPRK